jgi:hypothetical protein
LNATDLIVYLIGDKEAGRSGPPFMGIGTFTVRELQANGTPGSGALRLSLLFTRDERIPPEGSRFVSIEAEVHTTRVPPRTRGRVVIEANKRPELQLAGVQSLEWEWRLLPEELDAIEAETSPGDRWRHLRLELRGIVQVPSGTFPATGSSDFRVPLSEWEDLLRSLGYGVAPAAAQLSGLAATAHSSWAEVERRLAPARQALRAGDTHTALTKCLDQFAALAEKPYQAESWVTKLPDDPTQKKQSVAGLLAAHCTYLNRVGYHRDGDPGDGEELHPLPLDHWEAEVAVGVSQFLLTLALREGT